MAEKITAPSLLSMKQRGEKIVCVTAYDAYFARIMDEQGIDLILVGDSLGNVLLGYETTVPVSLAAMVHHTAAVCRGASRAMIVADMPFGSYQSSIAQCVDSAVALMKVGAHGVKLEGEYLGEISALVKAGIPVMGHIGMTPQSVNKFGGFKVQGKGAAGEALIDSAKRIEEAGAFSIVLELMPGSLASEISHILSIPTIGIGAGVACDGQIQVMHDILGMGEHDYKHAKRFVEAGRLFASGVEGYASEVRNGTFPADENTL